MKLYGYVAGTRELADAQPKALDEVTLVASPAELRKIAAFIEAAAISMEKMGGSYDHEHLSDKNPSFSGSPHFVISRSQ